MPSFQLTITPSRRAAARYINQVRRALQRALAAEGVEGLTQSEVARRINVHRSVVNRELKGTKDITQGRVGELAWAMGYEPIFELRKIQQPEGGNGVEGDDVEETGRFSVEGEWPVERDATIAVVRVFEAVE